MNWVDLIIILLAVGAVFRGLRFGLLQLMLSSAGFIGGLLLGSWLAKKIALHTASPGSKLLIILLIELFLAFALSIAGELAGMRLSGKVHKWRLGGFDKAFGAVFEVAFILIAVWLVASALTGIRSYSIGQQVRRSVIIRALNDVLPQPPDVLAQLEKIVSPNGFPNVFLGLEPQHTTVSPNNHVSNTLIARDEKSVVEIRGVGCGGIVEGSGFVVSPGIVVTNAHVIAGIRSPQVLDQSGSYGATAILYDPKKDVAVLEAPDLPAPPLTLSSKSLSSRDGGAVMGYPGGGPLVVGEAVVIDEVRAVGQDIYNRGVVAREIYELQARVEAGNSGGPLIGPDGKVAGIVFGKSTTQDNIGYALVISEAKAEIAQAEATRQPVASGDCTNY